MSHNSVTAIIPVYNGAEFLPEAIESILAQTHPVHEVIIADDGSTDDSRSVAMRYAPGVQVLSQPNAGPSAARNLGVRNATGSHLTFLDQDDVWTPDKLRLQMTAMDAGGYDMVFGRVEVFHQSGDLSPRQQVYEGVHVGAMLVTREAFDRVGEFAAGVHIGDFLDWYGRALDCGLKSVILPDIVMRRRLHSRNMTRGHGTSTGYFDVIREMIRRRERKTPDEG